jgi:hypothetical protein
MVEVSKAEFFWVIGPMNAHPRSERTESVWEHVSTREVIGRTTPGYVNPSREPARYFLTDKYAQTPRGPAAESKT